MTMKMRWCCAAAARILGKAADKSLRSRGSCSVQSASGVSSWQKRVRISRALADRVLAPMK